MLGTSWGLVLRARKDPRFGFARVAKSTGWKGGYKRKPPTGVHKCLSRTDMARLMVKLGE
jgi:hypothetical protein